MHGRLIYCNQKIDRSGTSLTESKVYTNILCHTGVRVRPADIRAQPHTYNPESHPPSAVAIYITPLVRPRKDQIQQYNKNG